MIACKQAELSKAIGYINLDRNVTAWSGDGVSFDGESWRVDGKVLSLDTRKQLTAITRAGVDAAIIAATLIKQQSKKSGKEVGAGLRHAAIITDPLDSPDSCEISYYGWLDYLRRYGSTCLDSQEDFNNKVFSVLSASDKSGRVVFTSMATDKLLLAIEVPKEIRTCDVAMRWMENTLPEFSNTSVKSYLDSRTNADLTDYFKKQIRKIRVN